MKKGQIYILAAIILIVIIYGMITVVNKASQESIKSDFEKLSQNYASEGAKLINDLKADEDQDKIINAFKDYTRDFTSYSKTKSTEFGFIYAFYYTGENKNKGRVYIGNYLNMPMLISYTPNAEDAIFVEGCYSKIKASVGFDGINLEVDPESTDLANCEKTLPEEGQEEEISTLYITIGGYGYQFDIIPDQLAIIIVSREDYPEQRKVFLEGNFAKDTGEDVTLFSDYCLDNSGEAGCSGETLICSAAYQTKDDCNRDKACKWNTEKDICENA